jgi:hypothetical protein
MAPAFIYHAKGIFWNYRRSTELYKNQYAYDKEWRFDQEWFIFVQLRPYFWNIEVFYYDGHRANSITILGVTFGYGYSHDSRPIDEWLPGE